MPKVKEFYTNAIEYEDEWASIWGHQVPFDGHTMNQFYNTPDIRNDEYG